MIASLFFSFTNFYLVEPEKTTFVGLENWRHMLIDPNVRQSLLLTLRFLVIAVPLAIVLPHLNAATGLRLTLQDCKVVFSRFYDFISYEQNGDDLLNRRNPLQLDNVYALGAFRAT